MQGCLTQSGRSLLGTSACASYCRWAASGFRLQLTNIDQHFWELLTHAKEPQGVVPFLGGQCFSEDVGSLRIGLDILQLDVVFIKHFGDGAQVDFVSASDVPQLR